MEVAGTAAQVVAGHRCTDLFDQIEDSRLVKNRADQEQPGTVFAAGCGAIVQYPYLQKGAARPRAVLGMFDISARMSVPADALTLAVPINKFQRMVANMDESFLTANTWGNVQRRIASGPDTRGPQ